MTRTGPVQASTLLWPLAAVLAAAAVTQVYAGLELTGLYGDGAYCLRRILTSRSFACVEPARWTTQFLLEFPTVLGVRLGIGGLYPIAAIFSLTLQLLPLVLTCACFPVLPARHRDLFVLPVLVYFAGSSAVASIGLLEGPGATAAFWLLFFLVLFTTERRGALVALTIVAIPAVFLHEVLLLLSPFLVAAAWWRADRAVSRGTRLLFRFLAAWFLVVAAVQAHSVIFPFREANRDGFVEQFFTLRWLMSRREGLNVPAVLGLLALLTIAAAHAIRRGVVWFVVGYGVATGVLVGLALRWDWYSPPISQFYARCQPAMISIPLALATFAALARPAAPTIWSGRSARAVLVILAAGTLCAQTAAARDWGRYIQVFRDALRDRSGVVAWEDLTAGPASEQTRLFRRMNWQWTAPDLSLLLAEHGEVHSFVANPRDHAWQPWDPAIREQWPASSFYTLPK